MNRYLSLHMIVCNEQKNLSKLLPYVSPYVGEMIIVDTGSHDGTQDIIRQYTGRVYQYTWTNDFSAVRNFALEQATLPWIFWLDADEWPTPSLLSYLSSFPYDGIYEGIEGISIRRHNLIDGNEIGVSTWERHVRVFRNGLRFVGKIHERLLMRRNEVIIAPDDAFICHYKSSSRQKQQDAFYMNWEEQKAIIRRRRQNGREMDPEGDQEARGAPKAIRHQERREDTCHQVESSG